VWERRRGAAITSSIEIDSDPLRCVTLFTDSSAHMDVIAGIQLRKARRQDVPRIVTHGQSHNAFSLSAPCRACWRSGKKQEESLTRAVQHVLRQCETSAPPSTAELLALADAVNGLAERGSLEGEELLLEKLAQTLRLKARADRFERQAGPVPAVAQLPAPQPAPPSPVPSPMPLATQPSCSPDSKFTLSIRHLATSSAVAGTAAIVPPPLSEKQLRRLRDATYGALRSSLGPKSSPPPTSTIAAKTLLTGKARLPPPVAQPLYVWEERAGVPQETDPRLAPLRPVTVQVLLTEREFSELQSLARLQRALATHMKRAELAHLARAAT
jgi:hypothetical protein